MDYAIIADKANRLVEWASGWDGFDQYLKLNALVSTEGDSSLNVIANDRIVTEYIDGSAIREFTAQLKVVTAWSSENVPTNAEAENYLCGLVDWINRQFPDNLPDWPGATITDIHTQNNAPSLDFVHEQDEVAEFSINVIITYQE